MRTVAGAGLDRPQVAAMLAPMVGRHEQRPPMYSALKHDGRPLYELARRGEEVERAPRPLTIHRLELLDLREDELEFEVVCSKGTYVRVLGEEIAAALGTAGHLVRAAAPVGRAVRPGIRWSRWRPSRPGRPACPATPSGRHGCCRWTPRLPALPRLDLDDLQSLHLRQGRAVTVPARPPPGWRARLRPGGPLPGPRDRRRGAASASSGCSCPAPRDRLRNGLRNQRVAV